MHFYLPCRPGSVTSRFLLTGLVNLVGCGPPQHIKHIRNTRVSRIPTFDEPCSSTLHPLNFVTVVFLVWVPNSGAILHKRANQRKVSRLLKLLWAALQDATQKRNLGVSLVCHGCNVVTESYPQVLSRSAIA